MAEEINDSTPPAGEQPEQTPPNPLMNPSNYPTPESQPVSAAQPTTPDAVIEVSPNDVKRSGDVFFPGELSAANYRERQKEELIKKYGPFAAAQMMSRSTQPLPDHMADLAANDPKPQTIGEVIAGIQPPAAEPMPTEVMAKFTTDHIERASQLHEDMSKMEPFEFFNDVRIQTIVRETTEEITPVIQEALQKNIKLVLEQNLQARDNSFQNTLQIPSAETTRTLQPVSDLLGDPKAEASDPSAGTPPVPSI